jgi:hypothetical protein
MDANEKDRMVSAEKNSDEAKSATVNIDASETPEANKVGHISILEYFLQKITL